MENTLNTTATATTATTATTESDLIAQVWQGNAVTVANGVAKSFSTTNLIKEGIVAIDNGNGTHTYTRNNITPTASKGRAYEMPWFAEQVRCLVRKSLDNEGMCNICLSGQAGTGKSEFVHELAREFGVKLYQVNGGSGLTSMDFYGNTSVAVDSKSGQNYTYFEKGPLYRAFIEGTQLDANGNQVLDANGEPIVVGKPAFFFLDEFAAMVPEVFLEVFNRVMEIPRQNGKGRSMTIALDNGREVKSHPGMVMFLSGNTVGTGNNGKYQMGFTAQSNKMDESTRNRITAFYLFDYNRKAEENIASSMLNDDFEVKRLMDFRDNMRNMFKSERVETQFTTRSLVATCEVARSFRKYGIKDWCAEAICSAILNGLPETDKPAFNETVRMLYGIDFMARANNG